MTLKDRGSWLLVLFVAVFVVPLVSATDRPMPAQVWPTDEPCEAQLAACQDQLAMADASLRRWEALAESWMATATAGAVEAAATIDALSTRLHRTPDGPDPTPTPRPSWRALLPMAVRGW